MAHTACEGTTLSYGDASSGPWTVVAEVMSIKPPGLSREAVPTTNLSSTYKSYRAGKIPGFDSLECGVQYDRAAASHAALDTLAASGAQKWWKIDYVGDGLSNPADDVFSGFITSWSPNEGEDEKNWEYDLTIQVTGVVTKTAGV